MKSVYLLILCLVFVQPVRSQRTRQPLDEAERQLRDELKKDADFVAVDCWRRAKAKTEDKDTSYRLKAVDAYRQEGEKIKLKMSCGTKEGDPIFSYLTVEKGIASIFIDTSQDDFGPQRVYFYKCSEFEIGVYFNDLKIGRMVFQTIE